MKTGKEFTLNCSDASFNQRKSNVFDQLLEIEKNAKDKQVQQMDTTSTNNRVQTGRIHKPQTRSFRGKESIFKVPQDPPSKHFLRSIPDFKKNPHKWTKYSLEDVKDEDLSDRGNTRAALMCLKELDARNKSESMENETMNELPKKIVFQKHVVSTVTSTVSNEPKNDVEKPSFNSSKIIMPEYVVGQKIKKERKNRKVQNEKNGKEMKLDHLFQEDEEDE